jgi:hypothetical protein
MVTASPPPNDIGHEARACHPGAELRSGVSP